VMDDHDGHGETADPVEGGHVAEPAGRAGVARRRRGHAVTG
jgi:hypothetical protein